MTDETLPAEWALDIAVKAAEYNLTWVEYEALHYFGARPGIIAHARTLEALAKHDPSIKPVDEDLLIAREICARVEEDWSENIAEAYRDGCLDDEPELQVTLSMLKRDPEALAAFRKEKGL